MTSTPQFTGLEKFGMFTGRQVGHDYNRQSEVEYNAIKGFVGHPSRVMDLGCGLGRMSVFVNWKLNDGSVHFILADANEITNEDNISGWNPGRDFYNDMQSTREFCVENGLENLTLFDINNDDPRELGKVDLLFSFLAVGFHFPIEESLHKFWKCLQPDSTLIFGVRHKRYGVEDFAEYFDECYLVQSFVRDYEKQTRKQHFLVLKNPRGHSPPPANMRRNARLRTDSRWRRKLWGKG